MSRFLVKKHKAPALRYAGMWFVVDRERDNAPRFIKVPWHKAVQAAARMNKGEVFDSRFGWMPYKDMMVRRVRDWEEKRFALEVIPTYYIEALECVYGDGWVKQAQRSARLAGHWSTRLIAQNAKRLLAQGRTVTRAERRAIEAAGEITRMIQVT